MEKIYEQPKAEVEVFTPQEGIANAFFDAAAGHGTAASEQGADIQIPGDGSDWNK